MAVTVTLDPAGSLRFNISVQDNEREIGHFSLRYKPNVLITLITIGQLETLVINFITAVQPILTGTIVKVSVEIPLVPAGAAPDAQTNFVSRDDKLRLTLLFNDQDTGAVNLPTPGSDIFLSNQETVNPGNVNFATALGAIQGPLTDGTNSWGLVNEDGNGAPVLLNGYRTRARGKFGTKPV